MHQQALSLFLSLLNLLHGGCQHLLDVAVVHTSCVILDWKRRRGTVISPHSLKTTKGGQPTITNVTIILQAIV